MQDAMDGQYIPGDRGERILADAVATLSDAMRCRLEVTERSSGLLLTALTGLSEMVRERLEAIDRNQQLLLEAVSALQWRIELLPKGGAADEPDRVRALEAEMSEALLWTRPDPDAAPFVIHLMP